MPDKNLTDTEIKKALEICGTYKGKCTNCPAFVKVDRSNCKKVLLGALDIINRLQAEIEKLKEIKFPIVANQSNAENINIAHIKAEAYKEFYEKLHTEILEARESNFKAKEERIAKSKEYGIPIDIEDNFLMYCDGKIHALDGVDYFAYETLKELVGEDNA